MMERLTERDDMGCAWYKTTEAPSHQRIEAHAAYEDTGMTPEDVTHLLDENERVCSALKLTQTRARDLESEVERLRALLASVRELADAEKFEEVTDMIDTVLPTIVRAALEKEDTP